MSRRGRGWLAWIGEVVAALLADRVLLSLAVLVVIAAVLAALLLWRFG